MAYLRYFGRSAFGVTAYDFRTRLLRWSTIGSQETPLLPLLSAPAPSRQTCCFTTLEGEFFTVPLSGGGENSSEASAAVCHWRSPGGMPISSSPAIADGRVHFGCDDGCLYVLGSGPPVTTQLAPRAVHSRKSEPAVAGERRYAWPSAYGGPENKNFIDDPGLQPPFRLGTPYAAGVFSNIPCAPLWRMSFM